MTARPAKLGALNVVLGVGNPEAGNVHVMTGFNAEAAWVYGRGCDFGLTLGTLSAGATVVPSALTRSRPVESRSPSGMAAMTTRRPIREARRPARRHGHRRQHAGEALMQRITAGFARVWGTTVILANGLRSTSTWGCCCDDQ